MEAAIALGTNLGDRLKNLQYAVDSLKLVPHIKVLAVSRVYETEPVGFADQGPFLNAVVHIESELSPNAILGACLGIEAAFGRRRDVKNGPRVLDMDLLLYSGVKIDSHELTIPHPRILERAFVMMPLQDLFPTGRAIGFSFGMHLRELGEQGVNVHPKTINI